MTELQVCTEFMPVILTQTGESIQINGVAVADVEPNLVALYGRCTSHCLAVHLDPSRILDAHDFVERNAESPGAGERLGEGIGCFDGHGERTDSHEAAGNPRGDSARETI